MSEWERIHNREIAPGDFIKLASGGSGEVMSVAEGMSGDLLVQVDVHYPVEGGPDNVVTGGTYAIAPDGNTQRRRSPG